MVSNVLEISEEDLMTVLLRLRNEHADDPDYRELRGALPPEWPI
jgi:hypothetical protein